MVDITVRSGERNISITMMECGALIPQPLHRPRTAPNRVLVAHPVDLVASKLLAIMTRDTERDFIDLYAADRHWPGIITAGMETAVQANKNSASAIAKTLADPPCQSAFRLDSDIRIRLAQAGAESEEALAHHRSQGPGTVNANAEQLNYDTRPELSRWQGTSIPPVANPIAETPERCRIAERAWWHGPPWTVLRNCGQFVRSVMDYADAPDARLMLADLGEERWRAALREARPRTMSRKSYVWWSLKLGLMQPGARCDWPYDGHANDSQPLANQSGNASTRGTRPTDVGVVGPHRLPGVNRHRLADPPPRENRPPAGVHCKWDPEGYPPRPGLTPGTIGPCRLGPIGEGIRAHFPPSAEPSVAVSHAVSPARPTAPTSKHGTSATGP